MSIPAISEQSVHRDGSMRIQDHISLSGSVCMSVCVGGGGEWKYWGSG